ncbi:hypothetical protein [Klebsiella pneumoniae]
MYHLDNTSGVPEMPEPKDEQSVSPRWFGESQEQGGISWPGADWFNTVQAELLNLLAAAGIQPEKKAFDQLSQAIPVLGEKKIREDLGSGQGASNVCYKKPYRSAVSRPIADMVSETISPFDFGIKSDAVFDPVTQRLIDGTDNTTAMQAMLCEAHYHGVEINFPLNGRFATKSLLLHYDAIKNPNWEGRPGRIKLTGSVTGHSTGDVETQGTAIYHIPGEASPLLSMIGEFSLTNPAAMGGYLSFGRLNLIGSQDSTDVLLLQGSQGQIELESYTVKVLNPYGNGVTESTTWETTHRNVLIRGLASLARPGEWKGIGLNIKSDDTQGQTNMKIYLNVDVYRMGTGIDIGRREKPQGTFGPLIFMGGQTSLSDEYGMRLGGGVISFSCIGMQHEGARKNGLLIDRTLPDGSLESDLARSIRIQQNYFTGCGTIEDGTRDSYAIYIANGDGVHLDEPTLNTVGNGIGFDSGVVDNLKISRPTFRTVRDYGREQGYGIRAFGEQNAAKRIELTNPIFNQNPLTPIDSVAKEIFGRAAVGGRVSFATNNPTPSLSKGSSTGGDSFKQVNFNNSASTVVTNILDGNIHQVLLITFSNTNTTLQHGSSIILQGGKDVQGAPNKVIQLYYNGSVWREIGDPVRSLVGTTANRPFSTAFPGLEYFDTTLNRPIWRNAANNGWVDSAGNAV